MIFNHRIDAEFYFLRVDQYKFQFCRMPVSYTHLFEITTIWDSMKDTVAFGDEVININGTSLKDCPMSQMAVEEIMNAIPGDTGYIIIKKDNQEKRIEIRKEK